MQGIITKIQFKKSKPKKSYGIISAFDGEQYYFKLNGLEYLSLGDEVSFKGDQNEKGFIATSVHPIG